MATRAERIEVACGVLAGVAGVVGLLVWLYAPLQPVQAYFNDRPPEMQYFSVASYFPQGWVARVLPPALAAYTLLPPLAGVALSACWHGARRASSARLWLWGAMGVLLLLLLAAPKLGRAGPSLALAPGAHPFPFLWALPSAAPFLLPSAALAIVASMLAVGVESDRRHAPAERGADAARPNNS